MRNAYVIIKSKVATIRENDRIIIWNVFGSFVIKGGSLVLSLFLVPAYMNYFSDNMILGFWFSLVSIVNWLLFFDLGIGNGLRNMLPESLHNEDYSQARSLIISAYVSVLIIAILASTIYLIVGKNIDWNNFVNVPSSTISEQLLYKCMSIMFFGVMLRFILGIITSVVYAIQMPVINNLVVFISSISMFLFMLLAQNRERNNSLLLMSWVNVVSLNVPLIMETIYVFRQKLRCCIPRISDFSLHVSVRLLRVGVTILWLQIVAMIVFSTHSYLISVFVGSEYVVEYQIYYKVFNSIVSVFALALTPIWSAVTKAKAAKDYIWIRKTHIYLLSSVVVVFVIEVVIIGLLQHIFNLWLHDKSILVNTNYAIVTAFFCLLYYLHMINTSFSNGMSRFQFQKCLMSFAAIMIIPFTAFFCGITKSWIGVLYGCILSILPYQLLQPFRTIKLLKDELSNLQKEEDIL